jgi:hypothetical protein
MTAIYINTIDECVNSIIDTLYTDIIDKKLNIDIKNIIIDFPNLIKKITKIIDNNVTQFNLNKLILDEKERKNIIQLLNNYLYLYLFFYLGLTSDLDVILKILNEINNNTKLEFFKNRYITQYSIYYNYIKDYHKILSEFEKNSNKDILKSLKHLDSEDAKLLLSSKEDLSHNILKLIIFRDIYMLEDKLVIFKILDDDEFKNAEFKYIDIVDSRYDTIDYAVIESLFEIEDVRKGIAEEIYNMVNDYESTKFIKDYTIDQKINQLFQKKILIPITDEFLRYHKDLEIQDQASSTNIEKSEKSNKKDNTKIKYIITKINKVKDFYTQNKKINSEIEKIFYQPLMYRKAVIINDTEEVNILRKLELQGKITTDSNEFFEDLKQIRDYPYIEFKYANRDSFNFRVAKDIKVETIRYTNFENLNNNDLSKLPLQTRIINDNIKANIVGIAIPRFNSQNTTISCNKVRDSYNMNLLNSNSYSVTIKKLQALFLNDSKKYSKLMYWLFDTNKDKIKLELFDNIKELPTADYIKLLLGKVYDTMVNITYELILKRVTKKSNMDFLTALKIFKNIEKQLILIPRQSNKYAEILKLIYYIINNKNIDTYDATEDKIPTSDYIKLPLVKLEKILLHIIKINKESVLSDNSDEIDMYEGYYCQHTVTWNNMMRLKRSDPNKFNQLLFNFINKYVTENGESNYVCKSCYQLIDLTKYTTDTYPGADSIAITYGLETELENIEEYAKWNKAIKNMDKMIEKVCYASNIHYFVGANQEIKLRRQEVIKNVIDLIESQYKTLFSKETNARKERTDSAIKKYGVSVTNLFLFKLENDIFTYSSKEIDKFKQYKINNILSYIMIGILTEINLSQILILSFDKVVNYFLFTKFGFNLFDNLYIRVSNKNDIAPIQNYKLLCYFIYYLSGIYAKFNMWYIEGIVYKPNYLNPQIQRSIIHTVVDALNTVLEVNSSTNEKKSYIYSTFATKYFVKLNTVFKNEVSKDIISRLEEIYKLKVSITADKKVKYNISQVPAIPCEPYISNGSYIIKSELGLKDKIASYPTNIYITSKLKENKSIDSAKINEVNKKLEFESLTRIATLYNEDGIKRVEQLSLEETKKIPLDKLKIIEIKSIETRLKSLQIIDKKHDIKPIKLSFENGHDILIDNFISKLEELVGKDMNINNNNYYLRYNAYEINHDYRGNKKTSIFLKDNVVKYKKDDPFFKQDVYYYEDTANHVQVYYSAIEKYLLGYKENSKDFTKLINTDAYLKIHYSLQYQLLHFGFNYLNNKIQEKIDLHEYINNILRIRLQNLKNSLSEIQQIIYQVKNNFNGSNQNPVAKYYISKIKYINTHDDESRIFKEWSQINNGLFYETVQIDSDISIKTLPNQNKYINASTLLKYSVKENIIISYIIKEVTKLLDINEENYTKVNIAYMISNIVFQLFRNFTNNENAFHNMNVKKFLLTSTFDISESFEIQETTLSEDEIEKIKEEKDMDQERLDSLDMEQDETTDDFGDEDVLLRVRD